MSSSVGTTRPITTGAPLTQDVLRAVGYRATLVADGRIYYQYKLKDFPPREVFRGIGVNASFGFKYQASPIVSLFGEMRIMGMNVNVAQAVIEDFDAELTLFDGRIQVAKLTENGGHFLGVPVGKEELKSLLDIIFLNDVGTGEAPADGSFDGGSWIVVRPIDVV